MDEGPDCQGRLPDGNVNRVLYLIHKEDDSAVDSYWPMNHGMTVFGFGRRNLERHMKQIPAHFIVGFCEGTDLKTVSRVLASAYRPLSIVVGAPELRPQAVGK